MDLDEAPTTYYALRNNDGFGIHAGDLIEILEDDARDPRDWVTVIQKNAMGRPERRRWIKALQSTSEDNFLIESQYVEEARRAQHGS